MAITPEDFITRWQDSGGHERGSGQMFLTELCDLLELPHPDPPQATTAHNDYVFERALSRTKPDGSQTTVFLDLYKAGHFVLETKQGVNPERTKDDHNPSLLKGLNLVSPSPNPAKGHGTRDTKAWDKSLERAYEQARHYIRDLPTEEPVPPFLIVCDVGYVIEIFADFSGTRGTYAPFPVAGQHRIFLKDLRDEKKRALLRTIFTDPKSLDPSKHAAKVTRDVSKALARLATSLESSKHHPEVVALFLQRCLFTLFAEDIGLLPEKSFENLLFKLKSTPNAFPTLVGTLWKEMATGVDFSTVISGETIVKIPHFNGGLFENPTALPLDGEQITLLLHAARQDWSEVEPAIFGTLLERALDPRDRHKLGAHYTPRSYVDRLIDPTLLQPLREQWDNAKAASSLHYDAALAAERTADFSPPQNPGDKPLTAKQAQAYGKKIKKAQDKARSEQAAAVKVIADFHHQLCATRVLDPACGSGNFLYVAMARMKELEAEVLDLLAEIAPQETLTAEMDSFKVRPDQFLGLEVNERATAIAQLVIWIGYFQWHKKATGKADTNDRPLLPKQSTIECRDAVLAYDEKKPLLDDQGIPVTIWDGHTTKPHPVTEKEVPDESVRKVVFSYENPRRTEWPEADYIVGNPPFIGGMRKRELLGDGYAEALDEAWKMTPVRGKTDFVMYWWHHAAELVKYGNIKRAGLITTNSISQLVNRRIIKPFLDDSKNNISLSFAIPDHPWVDGSDGAAVRIAMTVTQKNSEKGILKELVSEKPGLEGERVIALSENNGIIHSSLKIGANISSIHPLCSNRKIANAGSKLYGAGFLIGENQLQHFESEARTCGLIRPYKNGRDLNQKSRNLLVIDPYGLSEKELEELFPKIFQHLTLNVKPSRLENRNPKIRENWWIHGIPKKDLRLSLNGISKFISTTETSKHRFFGFMDKSILPDNTLVNIASDDALFLGVLSSKSHEVWALATGGRLGVGNDPRYNNTRCFGTFPFPDLDDRPELADRIRDLGERLDAHRKARQAEHPDLTLTGTYNVLEKLNQSLPLTDKEKVIHDQGLVTLLQQIHHDLDAAVLEAYHWQDLTGSAPLAVRLAQGDEALEQEILQRLVDLNHERAAEEAQGQIRYLRPEFQDPDYGKKVAQKQQAKLGLHTDQATPAILPTEKKPWPKTTTERIATLKTLLTTLPPEPDTLSTALKGNNTPKRRAEIQDLLEALASLGQL